MSESQHLTYKKKRKIKSQRLLSEQERFQQVLTLTLALGPPPSPVCPDPCDMCRQLWSDGMWGAERKSQSFMCMYVCVCIYIKWRKKGNFPSVWKRGPSKEVRLKTESFPFGCTPADIAYALISFSIPRTISLGQKQSFKGHTAEPDLTRKEPSPGGRRFRIKCLLLCVARVCLPWASVPPSVR